MVSDFIVPPFGKKKNRSIYTQENNFFEKVNFSDMDRKLLDQYTVSDIKDTILELPSGRRHDIIKYIDLLKLSDDLENPSQQ